jgi:BMFP domain-containing protein YqiC
MQEKPSPNLDEMVNRLFKALPAGMREFGHEADKNLRAALHSALKKMDLVTREEFDIQQGVLARTRAKLEKLEKQVAELEAALLKKDKAK